MANPKVNTLELKLLTIRPDISREDIESITYKTNRWLNEGGCITSLSEHPIDADCEKFHAGLIAATKKNGPFIPIFTPEKNNTKTMVGLTRGKVYLTEDEDGELEAYISATLVENGSLTWVDNVPVHLHVNSLVTNENIISIIEVEKLSELSEVLCYEPGSNNVH